MIRISPKPEVMVTAVTQRDDAEPSSSHQGDNETLGTTALWQA
jgi:hypothetical protein